MKIGGGWITLNGVPAYAGLAAADVYIGATALPDGDPRNNNGRPGKFRYGGAHVIEDLVSGKKVVLSAGAYGTDCYPRKNREQRSASRHERSHPFQPQKLLPELQCGCESVRQAYLHLYGASSSQCSAMRTIAVPDSFLRF